MPYIKLDTNIVDSSLLAEGGYEHVGFFMILCASADINGWTTVSVPALAKKGSITIEKAKAHLEALARVDPYSRTPDDEGRRIRIQTEPEWGIQIINHGKYRAKDHTAAARQRRFRERQKGVTVSRVTSRKTEGRRQRAKDSGEPTVPHTPPSTVELAKQFIHHFNWCTGRHCQATSEVVKKVKAALKGGTTPDEILCFPFIHEQLNQQRREPRTLQPDWMLRDGSRNTHNWIGEALREAGDLELGTRLSNVAGALHMVEKLRALGVKGNPTKEATNG
jgi:hypothetical protein